MTAIKSAPLRAVDVWSAEVEIDRRADGTMLVRYPHPLGAYPDKLTERLDQWARQTPDTIHMARRIDKGNGIKGDWRRVSYGEMRGSVRRIAASLLVRGLSPERPIVLLSDNDIEHAQLQLAAMYAGVPYAPISPAYSLVSSDYGKLKHIIGLLTPGLVFASDGVRYAKAIEAAVPADVEVVVTDRPPPGRKVTAFADLLGGVDSTAVDLAHAKVGPDTIAKFLFTSGSTGLPKGVIQTQRMLCSNQQIGVETVYRWMQTEPPVLVDWLPWNHTFGGNNNFGIALYNGGSFYIDEGRPVPGLIEETIRNLREISPTMYYNVPKGFEALVHYMRREPELRRTFYKRLRMNFYAGASLAQHLWDALEELAVETTGERVVMMSGLGTTETGPTALFCTMETLRSGSIGLPAPGVELKLVPRDGKLEVRAAGPSVTPGYWRAPELTAKAFDEEGFYCLGDAIKFADPAEPKKGFLFDGRLTEDFKLSSGTWVSVGPLKTRLIAAFAPLVRDAVLTGLDRDFVGAIVIPDVDACREFCGGLPAGEALRSDKLRAAMAERLQAFAATSTGSSTRVERLVVLVDPPSIDVGEITDKGSINQRAVLEHRRGMVEDIHAAVPSGDVICLRG